MIYLLIGLVDSLFDLIEKLFEEYTFIQMVIALFAFAFITNVLRFILFKIKKSNYLKNRNSIFKKEKKKHKVDRIIKKLKDNRSYYKLSSKEQKLLKNYVTFLMKDIKYNIYCENFDFVRIKRVNVKISARGFLGVYQGTPKRVFTKMAKASKKKKGLWDAVLLLEKIAFSRRLDGDSTVANDLRFRYTLSWTE